MSLIQSAGLNGHDPYAYLKGALMRLPTQRTSENTRATAAQMDASLSRYEAADVGQCTRLRGTVSRKTPSRYKGGFDM